MHLAKKIPASHLIVGGFFLFLDQLCKFLTTTFLPGGAYLWKPWLGLEFFRNNGVAFSLPVPNRVIIFLTVIILISPILFPNNISRAVKKWHLIFIYSGAVSNLIDRIFLGYTVDYIRIGYSVINLADIVIVIGILLIFGDLKIINWDRRNAPHQS